MSDEPINTEPVETSTEVPEETPAQVAEVPEETTPEVNG